MIVKNEQENLPCSLGSVRAAADELIVVDTGSNDRSPALAAELGAKVFYAPWRDDFAAARNAALDHARGRWLLIMDADEELPAGENAGLLACLQDPAADAWLLRVRNFHPGGAPEAYTDITQIRLFRNRQEYRYQGSVHERIREPILRAGGRILSSGVTLWHHGYAQSAVQGGESRQARNLRLLEAAAAREPQNAYNQVKLGLACYAAGQLALAHERLARGLALFAHQPDPTYDEVAHPALAALCRLALAQGDGKGAADYARQSAQAARHERQRRDSADLAAQAAALGTRPAPMEVLARLLDAGDLPAELEQCRPWLDSALLALVRADAQAALDAGEVLLAEGLSDLAVYIESVLSL